MRDSRQRLKLAYSTIAGGAIANLYALNAARHHMYPRAKHIGVSDLPTLCAFTSEDVRTFSMTFLGFKGFNCESTQAHYSIKSAAAVTGLGTDNCFNIPVDGVGRMIPEALEAKIVQ